MCKFLLGCAGFFAVVLGAGAHPPAAPVPAHLEIEVLDPNAHPRGLPAVELRPGPAGDLQIDIPPSVLVHRYYYTGDRTFQAAVLPGGPTIVVANHPKSGERLYIPVQMLPGAPKVRYTDKSIAYDYGNQTITVEFCCISGKAKVSYQHAWVDQKWHRHWQAAREKSHNLWEQTGIPAAKEKCAKTCKNAVKSTVATARTFGSMAVTPLHQIADMLPGASLLQNTPEELMRLDREAELERMRRKLEKSVPK